MTYQSEQELEELLLEQLEKQGYSRVKILDEKMLKDNFRKQVNIFNKEKLSGIDITDKEFNRIMIYIEGKNIFNSSRLFRDKFILEREDGSEIYLRFFDEDNYHNNIFQVTNQVTMKSKYVNRYDVTVLINGLPMIQIELKRRGKDFKEAFNQIERYRKHTFTGLYRYIQCFVISNGVDTKYYANSDGEINFDFTFFWSDENNKRITNLCEFAETFLGSFTLNNIIAKYMIIKQAEKSLMVMRPYQIYAVEGLIKRATQTNNDGYIWHTTGSGKTLTSFKASQLLAKEKNIKKVFFLVDRIDLDSQTVEEFDKFEKDCVDLTKDTKTLIKNIEDFNKTLIVTTIQKLARLLTAEKYAGRMEKYKDEKVIFIMDECHRSQFGEMHTAIKKHFNNAQYFGFTGTPRFEENKSQDGRCTEHIFGKYLHNYLIKDAINDKNVLGFSVEYIKTFDGDIDEYDNEKVKAIDKEEIYMADERIDMIAKHIVDNHSSKTLGGKFCAIFAVSKIDMLVKYYDAFKKLEHNLKIAAVYSYDDNEDSKGKLEHSRDSLERIIADYNLIYKEEKNKFSTDTFPAYFKDVSKKLKKGNIDIVIVVNMMLTGFDSKPLNTLYVDKKLNYHNLVQAFSRTNRILDSSKLHGNIVCYRNLKKETDEAIRLFSQTDSTDIVLMKSYTEYLSAFKDKLAILYSIAPSLEFIDMMQDENEKKAFVEAFRDLTKELTRLKTFTEFEFGEEKVGISAQDYEDYKSKYLSIYDTVKNLEKTSILVDIDFSIELMQTDKINVSYILNLIRDIDLETKEKTNADVEKIKNFLDKADSENLRLKADLLRAFLDEVVLKASKEDSINDLFNEFIEEKRVDEIQKFSKEVNLNGEKVKSFITEYEYAGKINDAKIKDEIKGGLLVKKKFSTKIKDFIINHVGKFTF